MEEIKMDPICPPLGVVEGIPTQRHGLLGSIRPDHHDLCRSSKMTWNSESFAGRNGAFPLPRSRWFCPDQADMSEPLLKVERSEVPKARGHAVDIHGGRGCNDKEEMWNPCGIQLHLTILTAILWGTSARLAL